MMDGVVKAALPVAIRQGLSKRNGNEDTVLFRVRLNEAPMMLAEVSLLARGIA